MRSVTQEPEGFSNCRCLHGYPVSDCPCCRDEAAAEDSDAEEQQVEEP